MSTQTSKESILKRMGIRRVINGRSWVTILGGSVMPPEVVEAMEEASHGYLELEDLYTKAGEVIARCTGAEAGLVTAGAAAGLLLEAAACMTGGDPAKIDQLPDTEGMKNEIIIQKSQRVGYDRCFRAAGARLVEVGSPEGTEPHEFTDAISEKTAAIAYIYSPWLKRNPPLREVVDLAHGAGVPVVVDGSAMLPPAENLTRYIADGADMVTFSGGKGVRGPQSTGILCGRKDLIEAARKNMSPYASIGRPAKVCKEEIVGLVAALERFVELDHGAEWEHWVGMSQTVVDHLRGIPGIRAVVETDNPDRQGPPAVIYFTPEWRGSSPSEIQQRLTEGDPSVHIGRGGFGDELWVTPVTLQDGEETIVGQRLREELTNSAS